MRKLPSQLKVLRSVKVRYVVAYQFKSLSLLQFSFPLFLTHTQTHIQKCDGCHLFYSTSILHLKSILVVCYGQNIQPVGYILVPYLNLSEALNVPWSQIVLVSKLTTSLTVSTEWEDIFLGSWILFQCCTSDRVCR